MAKAQEKKAPPKAPTEEEIESQELELTSQSLEEQARKKLTPSQLRNIKKIAYYIAKVGLPLEEACMLVDIDAQQFEEDMKLEPLLGKIIRIKTLEYKKDLMFTLSQRARSGDDKLAAWLLERRYPEEFSDRKRKGPGDDSGKDIIFEAIRFIRRNGSNDPMVIPSSGDAVLSAGERDKKIAVVPTMDEILGGGVKIHEHGDGK